jgi:hypothetical protein
VAVSADFHMNGRKKVVDKFLQHSLSRSGGLAKIRDLSVINSRSWHGCDSVAEQRFTLPQTRWLILSSRHYFVDAWFQYR